MARCIQSIAVPFDNLIAQSCNHPRIPPALLQFHTRLVVVPDVRMALRLIHQQLHASAVKLGKVIQTRDKDPTLGASTSARRRLIQHGLHARLCTHTTGHLALQTKASCIDLVPKLQTTLCLHAERLGRPDKKRQSEGGLVAELAFGTLRPPPKAAKEAGSNGALRLEPTALACAPMLVRAFQGPNKPC